MVFFFARDFRVLALLVPSCVCAIGFLQSLFCGSPEAKSGPLVVLQACLSCTNLD